MKVSLNWIKDYVDLPADMDLKRLAYDLTMSTVEVEDTIELAKALEKEGIDAFHISGGDHHTMIHQVSPMAINVCHNVWAAEAIKKHVHVPVIANGDVFTAEDAVRILSFTGADMAMIGRGCFGNPWLFQQCAAALEGEPIPPLPPLSERCDLAVRQIELAREDKGEHIAILEARRHCAWYLKGVPHANYYKDQIVRMNTMEDVYRVTAGIKRDLK